MRKNFKRTTRQGGNGSMFAEPLSGAGGRPEWLEESSEVTIPLQRMLARLTRKEPLPATIAVVSALRQEGVTYISRRFGAIVAQELNTPVCVVELNWNWPSSQVQFANTGGIAGVLMGDINLQQAILPGGMNNLYILPAGHLPAERRMGSARSEVLRSSIAALGEQFPYVILDIPSILFDTNAVPLASLAKDCVLVVHQGATNVNDIRAALDEIDHLHMLGVVMNKVHRVIPQVVYKLIPQ